MNFLKDIWQSVLVGVGAVAVGVLGSVKSDDINSSFPFTWVPFEQAGINPWAMSFWVFLTLLFIGYMKLSRKTYLEKQKQVEALITSAEDIKVTVATMPPKNLLIEFNNLFTGAFWMSRFCHEFPDSKPKKEKILAVEEAIRGVLNDILSLVSKFDALESDVKLSINIMIAVETSLCKGEKLDYLQENLIFEESWTDVSKMYGALVLVPSLSTNTEEEATTPDNIDAFVLGLPYENNGEIELSLILPGAPRAYYDDAIQGYPNIYELLAECQDNSRTNLTPSQSAFIFDHFNTGPGKEIEGFMSKSIEVGDTTLGILNIHSNQPDLLESPSVLVNFYHIIQPFNNLLGELLLILSELETDFWYSSNVGLETEGEK